uniref:CBP80/20-dependent translation initiation factor n=2 Tax=Lygus hesperus TaxID=30085 RepID=A0A0A9XED2_LYGHE
MEGRGLQRSYTQVEFPVTRSARSQHHHYHQGRQGHHKAEVTARKNNNNINTTNNNMTGTRVRPGMELYKPPSTSNYHSYQRDPGANGTRLNVHAKEFVMENALQGSKSTGNILHAAHDETSHKKTSIKPITNFPLATSKSVHQQAQQSRGVQFVEEQEAKREVSLKRSKSMSAAHGAHQTYVSSELSLFEKHSASDLVKKACFNPDELQSMQLMDLAKVLVDKAMDDRAHAQSYASICLNIIEKESSGTFLESLLNISQYTVEKKCYKDGTHRYHAFMAFLNELYSLLKPRQVHLRPHATVSPTLTVLSLIVQVCQSVLAQKNLTHRTEVECLFFTVTTVGRDIEAEEPKLLDALMWSVRDAFLSPTTSPPIKKTLLQLVELRATKWHLPATAIMYYQSPNP